MAGQRAFLRALASRLVPPSAELDGQAWEESFAIMEDALERQGPWLRAQFAAFLGLLRWAPLLTGGPRFEGLDACGQDAWLRWCQDHPLRLVRAGFWGLRTLVFMGYYGRPQAWSALGYAPVEDGNERLNGPSRVRG